MLLVLNAPVYMYRWRSRNGRIEETQLTTKLVLMVSIRNPILSISDIRPFLLLFLNMYMYSVHHYIAHPDLQAFYVVYNSEAIVQFGQAFRDCLGPSLKYYITQQEHRNNSVKITVSNRAQTHKTKMSSCNIVAHSNNNNNKKH